MKNVATILGFVLAATRCASGAHTAHEPRAAAVAAQSAEAMYRTGLEQARAHDYVRAEQYLAASQARGYPAAKVVPALVRVCLASARLRAALHYAEPFIAENPDALGLRYVMSSVLLGLGQPDRARTELEAVIAQDPRHAPAHYLLAVTLRDDFEDSDGAAREFSAYLALAPNGAHAAEARLALAGQEEPEFHRRDRGERRDDSE